ncbi:unnamed protein product [Rotaria sp. Silwood1]|nr:unnamed protein product [Rotaria sp. Silwood1]
MFLTKISSQLERLRLNSFKHVNYLDASRWERIIPQYLQHLNLFEFQRIQANSYEGMNNDVSFIDDLSQNIQPDKIISNEQVFATSSMMFSETNQLDIIDLSYYTIDQGFFDMIFRIQTAVIECIPNLDSLVILSLEMVQPIFLSIEETRTLRLLSVKNKITKIRLQQMNDLKQVEFLLDLCPRIKYFDVDYTNDVLTETVLRFILMKNIKRISSLSLLCLKVS